LDWPVCEFLAPEHGADQQGAVHAAHVRKQLLDGGLVLEVCRGSCAVTVDLSRTDFPKKAQMRAQAQIGTQDCAQLRLTHVRACYKAGVLRQHLAEAQFCTEGEVCVVAQCRRFHLERTWVGGQSGPILCPPTRHASIVELQAPACCRARIGIREDGLGAQVGLGTDAMFVVAPRAAGSADDMAMNMANNGGSVLKTADTIFASGDVLAGCRRGEKGSTRQSARWRRPAGRLQ
jgi:hypothetical protein